MKRKLVFGVVILAALAGFAAGAFGLLRFTAPENAAADGSGELVGVLITTAPIEAAAGESVDTTALFDPAHPGKTSLSAQRICAGLREDAHGAKQYVFDNVDGIAFFAARIGEADDAYMSSTVDEAVCDVHINYKSDGGVELEGSIYYTENATFNAFHVNPVRQTADGTVYVDPGETVAYAQQGIELTQSLKENYTVNGDGETQTKENSVELTFTQIYAPETAAVLQFDAAHNLLTTEILRADAIPEKLTFPADAAYAIEEHAAKDAAGNEIAARALYDRSGDPIRIYAPREDGICVGHDVETEWK